MTQSGRWLFVSDVDDTLLGDDAALVRLAEALHNASNLIVAYNSSRPCASLRQTLSVTPHLPTPDYLIGGMGTEIEQGKSGQPLPHYTRHLSDEWDREQIVALMAKMDFTAHSSKYQTPLKVSYDVPDYESYRQVLQHLEAARLKAKVIFSGGKNLDLIPVSAGKGNVITYLRQLLYLEAERVVVAGDSGNDLEMFVPPNKGIIVGNAAPELKQQQGNNIYQARSNHASGVLEGLRFWQVLP